MNKETNEFSKEKKRRRNEQFKFFGLKRFISVYAKKPHIKVAMTVASRRVKSSSPDADDAWVMYSETSRRKIKNLAGVNVLVPHGVTLGLSDLSLTNCNVYGVGYERR